MRWTIVGLDYSYDIYVPVGNVGRALTAVSRLAPADELDPPLYVTLPDGDQLVLPFTSFFRSDPIDCTARESLHVDTSLMVDIDDAVHDYLEWCDRCSEPGVPAINWQYDRSGRVMLGYIYLTVYFVSGLDPRFAHLQFTAATTEMSLLFERSGSIRDMFNRIASDSAGVCCVLDTERDIDLVCWLNGQEIVEYVPGPRFASGRELVASWRR